MHKETISQTDFTFKIIDSQELLEEVFQLRYQVYCKECNFIKEEDYPQRRESDKYDPYSLHFVAEDSEGIIGTARLVLNSELGFPLEEHCGGNLFIKRDSLPREKIAEVSRLVISKAYRRRKADGLYYTPDYNESPKISDAQILVTRIRPMAFGIYREMYQESKRRGIAYWYAVMEKSLYLLLRMHGFIFEPIGEEIDYYGPVRPYLGTIKEIEKTVSEKSPKLLQYFLDGLEPEYLIKPLS